MFKNLLKTFSKTQVQLVLTNKYLGSRINSFKAPFCTTRPALNEEKLQLNTSFGNLKNTFLKEVLNRKVEKVKLTFVLHDGKRIETEGKIGDSLLDVVVNNDLNIEGYGACEGTLTCSTCHVILKQEDYDRLPEEPCDEERDMLDLAYGLTDTSRLGCQIILTKDLENLEVKVPETINDARS